MRKALPCQESREFGGWNIEGQISDPQSWRQSPALWDILSLASLFCAFHRDGELQSRTEAPAFRDAPHPEFPAEMGNGSCHPQASGNMGMMEHHQLSMTNLSTKCWLLQGGDGRKFSSIFVADPCPRLAWLCLFQGAKGRALCPHTRTRSGNI